MTTALFVGRFQPLHNGHLNIIKQLLTQHNLTIIAIGSSQYSNTKENPFTAQQRIEMIQNSLTQEDKSKFKIILIPDIHDNDKWVKHIEKLCPKFNIVYTGSQLTKQLFEKADYTIHEITRTKESSTEIRKLIKENNDKWKTLVPSKVKDYLEKINAKQIIQLAL